MSFLYTSLSGERTRQIDLSSVPQNYIPSVGWVCNLHSQAFTVETRVSFDGGSTWTTWTTVNNRDQLPDYYDASLVRRTDLVEVRQSFSSTDPAASPVLESFFIYFPEYEPYISSTLPALNAGMEFYNHVEIGKSDFPLMTLSIEPDESYLNRDGDMELEFRISFEAHAGFYMEAELPGFTIQGEVDPGYVAGVSCQLPSFNADLQTGGMLTTTIPALSFEVESSYIHPADISCRIPSLSALIFASRASQGDMAVGIPSFALAMSALNGEVVEVAGVLPRISVTVNVLPGDVATVEATVPVVTYRMSSVRTGPAELIGALPAIDALVQSGEIESNVLRYVKGKSR